MGICTVFGNLTSSCLSHSACFPYFREENCVSIALLTPNIIISLNNHTVIMCHSVLTGSHTLLLCGLVNGCHLLKGKLMMMYGWRLFDWHRLRKISSKGLWSIPPFMSEITLLLSAKVWTPSCPATHINRNCIQILLLTECKIFHTSSLELEMKKVWFVSIGKRCPLVVRIWTDTCVVEIPVYY